MKRSQNLKFDPGKLIRLGNALPRGFKAELSKKTGLPMNAIQATFPPYTPNEDVILATIDMLSSLEFGPKVKVEDLQ